jgi:phosphoribosylformimino-5-aminoimidazole carboxamide ribonucleotide (ProFAR) isomerase
MLAIPVIDVRNGLCADPRAPGVSETPGLADPLAMARAWATAGFRRVHIRDLDAAVGRGSNHDLLEDIARDGAAELQIECSAESTDDIERLFDAGASHVVLGPRGIEEPEWTASLAEAYPGVLVIGTDVRERRVSVRGWVRNLPIDILDLAEELSSLPLGGLMIATAGTPADFSRSPLDLNLLEDLAETCDFPIIAVGGVTTMHDIRALEHRRVSAVVLDGGALASIDARTLAAEFGV